MRDHVGRFSYTIKPMERWCFQIDQDSAWNDGREGVEPLLTTKCPCFSYFIFRFRWPIWILSGSHVVLSILTSKPSLPSQTFLFQDEKVAISTSLPSRDAWISPFSVQCLTRCPMPSIGDKDRSFKQDKNGFSHRETMIGIKTGSSRIEWEDDEQKRIGNNKNDYLKKRIRRIQWGRKKKNQI